MIGMVCNLCDEVGSMISYEMKGLRGYCGEDWASPFDFL